MKSIVRDSASWDSLLNLLAFFSCRLDIKRRSEFDDVVKTRFFSPHVRDAVEELWSAEECWNAFLVSLDASSHQQPPETHSSDNFPKLYTTLPECGGLAFDLLTIDGNVVVVTLSQLLKESEKTALIFLRHFG